MIPGHRSGLDEEFCFQEQTSSTVVKGNFRIPEDDIIGHFPNLVVEIDGDCVVLGNLSNRLYWVFRLIERDVGLEIRFETK